ncbi:hypothetical protein Brsp07_04735 [Brucella sp. NBRC 14130]
MPFVNLVQYTLGADDTDVFAILAIPLRVLNGLLRILCVQVRMKSLFTAGLPFNACCPVA